MYCIHHNDMDGHCSGAIVYNYHKQKGEKVRCLSADHSFPFTLDDIKKDEKVYIVDFSLSEEQFKELLDKTSDVIWIDHHQSAMEKFKGTDVEKLEGIRRNGEAGCELAWEYFYGKGKNVKVPTIVRMLGRYDVWDFSLYGREKSNALQEFCKTINTTPTSDIWDKWLKDDYSPKEELEVGSNYLKYRDATWKLFLDKWAFDVEFEGLKGIACNIANVNSEFYKSIDKNKYDILILFVYNGVEWTFSIYSDKDKIDCSKIATKYGGGGHKNASGFNHENLPFKKIKKIAT